MRSSCFRDEEIEDRWIIWLVHAGERKEAHMFGDCDTKCNVPSSRMMQNGRNLGTIEMNLRIFWYFG
jgi:hypothetical protein